MPNFSETERLPTSYAAAIGRVIARWSYQEWLLSQIAYRLLGVGPKQGRAAVRSPRAEDYVTIFQHLIKLRHLTVSVDLLGFKKALKAAENERDLLAHSLWLLEPGTRKVAGIWLTKGNWKSGQFHPQGTPKILQPQFVQKKPQDLRASYKSIDATIKITRKLEGELKALLPPWP